MDAVGRGSFLSSLMSVFVFDILQIPSGWNETCIRCIGPTSTLPGHRPALCSSEFHINYIWNCLRSGKVSKIYHANAASSSALLGLQGNRSLSEQSATNLNEVIPLCIDPVYSLYISINTTI